MRLHPTQNALLNLIRKRKGDLRELSLRDIGTALGIDDRAQIVAHHLDQLQKKGLVREVAPKEYRILKTPVSDIAYINLYRATAQCGPNGTFAEDDIIDRVPMATKMFGIAHPSHFFLIKAKGQSMEPLIHEGDLVLAHIQSDVDSGKIAVVVYEDMPMIKRVKKLFFNEKRQHILLQSTNPEEKYEDIEVTTGENFRICGVVKGVLRSQSE